MFTTLSNISVRQLKRAVVVRERIEKLEHELQSILGEAPAAALSAGNGSRRTMSASARAKIAAAQRARWAKQKKDTGAPVIKRRRKMSAAARAKIAAAARARWAKAKAANRKTLAG
jgi:hypothetical protein